PADSYRAAGNLFPGSAGAAGDDREAGSPLSPYGGGNLWDFMYLFCQTQEFLSGAGKIYGESVGKDFYSSLYLLAVVYGSIPSSHDCQDHRQISDRRQQSLGSDTPGGFCRLSGQSSRTGAERENGRNIFSGAGSDIGGNDGSGGSPGPSGISG